MLKFWNFYIISDDIWVWFGVSACWAQTSWEYHVSYPFEQIRLSFFLALYILLLEYLLYPKKGNTLSTVFALWDLLLGTTFLGLYVFQSVLEEMAIYPYMFIHIYAMTSGSFFWTCFWSVLFCINDKRVLLDFSKSVLIHFIWVCYPLKMECFCFSCYSVFTSLMRFNVCLI